jgi:hypothetical protein
MELVDRARRYVAAMDPSVSGSGGHNAAFAAASALVHGFALSEEDALAVLRSEFNPRCSPAWSEGELKHKVRSAMANPGDKARGYLAGADRAGYQPGSAVAQAKPSGPRAVAPEKKRAEYALSLMEQFMSEQKQFRITNSRGGPEFITINDGLPQNDITRSKADFIIDEDDYRASVRQAQVAELLDLLGKLAPVAPQSRADDARGPAEREYRRRGVVVGARQAACTPRGSADPDGNFRRRAGG